MSEATSTLETSSQEVRPEDLPEIVNDLTNSFVERLGTSIPRLPAEQFKLQNSYKSTNGDLEYSAKQDLKIGPTQNGADTYKTTLLQVRQTDKSTTQEKVISLYNDLGGIAVDYFFGGRLLADKKLVNDAAAIKEAEEVLAALPLPSQA